MYVWNGSINKGDTEEETALIWSGIFTLEACGFFMNFPLVTKMGSMCHSEISVIILVITSERVLCWFSTSFYFVGKIRLAIIIVLL